jgi:hypothetical protein
VLFAEGSEFYREASAPHVRADQYALRSTECRQRTGTPEQGILDVM